MTLPILPASLSMRALTCWVDLIGVASKIKLLRSSSSSFGASPSYFTMFRARTIKWAMRGKSEERFNYSRPRFWFAEKYHVLIRAIFKLWPTDNVFGDNVENPLEIQSCCHRVVGQHREPLGSQWCRVHVRPRFCCTEFEPKHLPRLRVILTGGEPALWPC